jgi:hypothetical protein
MGALFSWGDWEAMFSWGDWEAMFSWGDWEAMLNRWLIINTNNYKFNLQSNVSHHAEVGKIAYKL